MLLKYMLTTLGKHSITKMESQRSVWSISRLVARRTTFSSWPTLPSLNPPQFLSGSNNILADFLAKTFILLNTVKVVRNWHTQSYTPQDRNHTKIPGKIEGEFKVLSLGSKDLAWFSYWAWSREFSLNSLKIPIEKCMCEKIDTKQEVYLAQSCDSPW